MKAGFATVRFHLAISSGPGRTQTHSPPLYFDFSRSSAMFGVAAPPFEMLTIYAIYVFLVSNGLIQFSFTTLLCVVSSVWREVNNVYTGAKFIGAT